MTIAIKVKLITVTYRIVHYARVMSVINDAQTNHVCALSITITSYFCLNTAQYIHIVEYSECFITGVEEVSEDQWCLCAYGHLTEELAY